jgi:hypothetical protein
VAVGRRCCFVDMPAMPEALRGSAYSVNGGVSW